MAVEASLVDADDLGRLIARIEKDFGVSFGKDAFEACETVGEVFDFVWERLPEAATSGGKCATQMAFYRLRSELGDRNLKPDTQLSDIKGFRYIALQRSLERQGWKAPEREAIVSLLSWCPLLAWLAAMFAAAWAADHRLVGSWVCFLPLPIPLFGAYALHRWVFTWGRPYAATLGELARHFVLANALRFRAQGATFTRRWLWDCFEGWLSEKAMGGPVVRKSGFY